MAQRKSPSYPEWPVDRSVYSLFCGVDSVRISEINLWPLYRLTGVTVVQQLNLVLDLAFEKCEMSM